MNLQTNVFFHIKKGCCPSMCLLFFSFLFTFFFTLFIGESSIFYLSVLHLWFLLRLALYPSLSIPSTIRNIKLLECALLHFLCKGAFILVSVLGDIHLFNSPEKQVRTRDGLYLNWQGTECLWPLLGLSFFVVFFNWRILQRYLVLPTKRKRNISKLRGRNPFAFRP